MLIDLRSDTVTKPSENMLDAMFSASVGDDVFGEDEVVNELEQKTAAIFDMEAGLFCPSGTMTNQIAIKIHTNAPGEIICDQSSHIYNYEGGGIAFNSGLSVSLIHSDRGILSAEDIENAINPNDVHKAETQLVSIENTCNRGGGSIYTEQNIKHIYRICKKRNLPLHLDGARLFNAIVKDQQNPKNYGKYFNSISICLSKGLGAPVGSVLIGSNELIRKARRIRKLFGGGMRQAGYLAAAGIYALDHNINRLKEDHELATSIGSILESKNYIDKIAPIETNIIIFQLKAQIDSDTFLKFLEKNNIRAVSFGSQLIRFVTHLDIQKNMLAKLESVLSDFEDLN